MKDERVVVAPIPKDFIVEQIEGAVLGEAAGALLKMGGKYVVSKSGKVIGKLSDLVKSTSKEVTEETTEKVVKKETGNIVEHIVKEQSEKGFKEIVSDKNLLSKSVENGSIKNFYDQKWTAEQIKMLPLSESSGIKKLSGTVDDAKKFFKAQAVPGTLEYTEKGIKAKTSEGYIIFFREESSQLSGYVPTIDINGLKGIRKIKFVNEGV